MIKTLLANGATQDVIAEIFNVSQGYISGIKNEKLFKDCEALTQKELEALGYEQE